MSHLESSIEHDTWTKAEAYWSVVSSKLVTPGQTGWPDRIFWLPGGKPLLIEFKQAGEEAEVLQKHRHKVLRDLGYDVHVCDSVQSALTIIWIELLKRGVECKRPNGG